MCTSHCSAFATDCCSNSKGSLRIDIFGLSLFCNSLLGTCWAALPCFVLSSYQCCMLCQAYKQLLCWSNNWLTAGAADFEACPLGVNPDDCCQHSVSGFVVRETSFSQLIFISHHSLCDLKLSPLCLQGKVPSLLERTTCCVNCFAL